MCLGVLRSDSFLSGPRSRKRVAQFPPLSAYWERFHCRPCQRRSRCTSIFAPSSQTDHGKQVSATVPGSKVDLVCLPAHYDRRDNQPGRFPNLSTRTDLLLVPHSFLLAGRPRLALAAPPEETCLLALAQPAANRWIRAGPLGPG